MPYITFNINAMINKYSYNSKECFKKKIKFLFYIIIIYKVFTERIAIKQTLIVTKVFLPDKTQVYVFVHLFLS